MDGGIGVSSAWRIDLSVTTAGAAVFRVGMDLRYDWVLNSNFYGGECQDRKSNFQLFPPEEAALLDCLFSQALDSGQTQIFDIRLHCLNSQREILLEFLVDPLREEDGRIKGLTGAAIDLSPEASRLNALPDSRATADDARAVADDARTQADDARLVADDARTEADDARAIADDARTHADDARAIAKDQWTRADDARALANDARTQADDARTQADDARAVAKDQRIQANDARAVAKDERTQADDARAVAKDERTQANDARAVAKDERTQADDARALANDARTQADDARAIAQDARRKAEDARTQADDARAIAEDARKKADDARAVAEDARIKAEGERIQANDVRSQANDARTQADDARAVAKDERIQANDARTQADDARAVAEDARKKADDARAVADNTRAVAENARIKADDARADAVDARIKAEEANWDKTRLMATAGHDIRQPLQAMAFFKSLAQERFLVYGDESGLKAVEAIGHAISSAEELLTSLMSLATLDSGAVAVHVEECSTDDVVDSNVSEFRAMAEHKKLKLRVRPCAETIRSDPVLLKQIIRNLTINAIKYTDRGGILVGFRRRGMFLRIDVWDTGRGIPEDKATQIFDEFYRGDESKDRGGGLGIGLSIVKKTARLLGHEVTVRSRLGKGSLFAVTVPLA